MAVRWPKLRDIRSVGAMVLRIGPFFALGFGVLSGVLTGVEEGLAKGLIDGVLVGIVLGLISGVVFGVPLGLVDVWRVPLAAMLAVTPWVVYQRDVRSHRVSGLTGGLTGGIVGANLGVRGQAGFPDLLFYGLALGLTLGLTFGIVSGLVSGFRAGAASSLLFTEVAFLARGRRVRFMPMLETALAGKSCDKPVPSTSSDTPIYRTDLRNGMRLGLPAIQPPSGGPLGYRDVIWAGMQP